MNAELNLLKQFFGGYFHEDWYLEVQTPDEAIVEYIAHSNPRERLALSKAIDEYVDRHPNEDGLARGLYRELGCYYDPTPTGMTVREWLQGIAVLLLNTN